MNIQIATAVDELSMVAAEVDRSVTTIREASEYSSKNVGHTSSASENLSSLSSRLSGAALRFRY